MMLKVAHHFTSVFLTAALDHFAFDLPFRRLKLTDIWCVLRPQKDRHSSACSKKEWRQIASVPTPPITPLPQQGQRASTGH